jgi:glycosyltransferase involved in cell wall biosynthesis
VRLPISSAMERHLRERYGVSGIVLPPIPSSDPVCSQTKNGVKSTKQFVVGYAGALDSRYKTILEQLSAELDGTPIHLNIYSRSVPEWPIGQNTSYRGYFEPQALWPKVREECDALLFAFGRADSKEDGIVRYSFPSKVTEYLRLGLPVLVAAPEYSAVWQWASKREDSLLLCQQDPAAILRHLLRLRGNPDFCARLGCAARRLYELEFEPAKMRERFREILAAASDGHAL